MLKLIAHFRWVKMKDGYAEVRFLELLLLKVCLLLSCICHILHVPLQASTRDVTVSYTLIAFAIFS